MGMWGKGLRLFVKLSRSIERRQMSLYTRSEFKHVTLGSDSGRCWHLCLNRHFQFFAHDDQRALNFLIICNLIYFERLTTKKAGKQHNILIFQEVYSHVTYIS